MLPDPEVGLSHRPVLLFYCQHSLGIGHLTRSFALVRALVARFQVVFLNGGRLPAGIEVPGEMLRIDMPALGMDDGHTVISRSETLDVDQVRLHRSHLIEQAVRRFRPAIVLVEMFPFGRKKFSGEILAMIRLCRDLTGGRVKVVCSLRDILVDARPDQQHHDDRARWLADRYFDRVLVHADPSLARLDDTFRPRVALRVPVEYTGYVVPSRPDDPPVGRGEYLLVSAGGGIVGDGLFRMAIRAREYLSRPLPMRIVAGPFLPENQWQALRALTAAMPDIELVRQVPDLALEMRRARASLSQCGYNTALDIAVSGVPALVVPYATSTENEQERRAVRLAEMGALRHRCARLLDAATLAQEIERLLAFEPCAGSLDLNGAASTERHLVTLMSSADEWRSAGEPA